MRTGCVSLLTCCARQHDTIEVRSRTLDQTGRHQMQRTVLRRDRFSQGYCNVGRDYNIVPSTTVTQLNTVPCPRAEFCW